MIIKTCSLKKISGREKEEKKFFVQIPTGDILQDYEPSYTDGPREYEHFICNNDLMGEYLTYEEAEKLCEESFRKMESWHDDIIDFVELSIMENIATNWDEDGEPESWKDECVAVLSIIE